MTDLAKGLLAYMEKLKAERETDPIGYEQRRKKNRAEALDKVIETLNTIDGLLRGLEERPEEFTDLEELGGLEAVKAKLEQERADYRELYSVFSTELPEIDIDTIKAESEREAEAAEAEGYITLTAAEYDDLISGALDDDRAAKERLAAFGIDYDEEARLASERRQTNKELLNVLSEGKGAEAEALLMTATLDDYAAAGVSLSQRQRDAILSGAAVQIKGIIYDLLFTELLKLWQVIFKRQLEQPGGGLELVPYSFTKPQKTAISVSKVALHLAEIEERGESGAIVDVGGKRDILDVSAIMRYDDKNITLLGRPVNSFDKLVHDGVAAIYAAGNTFFTVQDLYRACNGLDIKYIDEQTLEPYIESIEASRQRLLRIDATDQVNAYYKGKIKKFIYDDNFLPLKGAEIELSNGTILKGYVFKGAPPLYEYSSNIRQIVSAPMRLLRASKTVRNTPEVALITNYLIQRIDGIKNKKNALQNKIAYDAIFTAASIDTSKLDRTQLKRKRDIVKAKLDYFKLQGFIVDYTEYKNGRQAGGVEIIT